MQRPLCCRAGEEDGEEEMELPGFRFHPTDEELLDFYLRKRVEGRPLAFQYLITDLDIYKYDPWDLPKMARLGEGQRECYFFCPRDRKYRNSTRPNRVTLSGFWKATGTDKQLYSVSSSSECIGLKKSLVFYLGRSSKGTKTDWMMHEFRLPSPPDCSHTDTCWAICRIFKKKASTTQFTMPKVISGERPCSDGLTSEMSLPNLHAHANHDTFELENFSEEDSKSQSTAPTSTLTSNSHIPMSPGNHIQSTYTSPDETTMGRLVNPCNSTTINTPSFMQRQPLTLKVNKSSNSEANWADDFLLTPPITKPSDNLRLNDQPYTLGDGNTLLLDQPFQEPMQLLTPDCLGYLLFSPQGSPALPLWDQPAFFLDSSSSFYAMT